MCKSFSSCSNTGLGPIPLANLPNERIIPFKDIKFAYITNSTTKSWFKKKMHKHIMTSGFCTDTIIPCLCDSSETSSAVLVADGIILVEDSAKKIKTCYLSILMGLF